MENVKYDEWGSPIVEEVKEFEYKEEKRKKLSPFDYVKCLLKKCEISQEDKAKIDEYMTITILSNNPNALKIAQIVNTIDIPKENLYNFIDLLIPKGVLSYIPYPKKIKEDNIELLEIISDYYKCNFALAKRYLSILPAEEIEKIKKKKSLGGRL